MLSSENITLVKSTIPLLEASNTQLTEHFYKRMFQHNPELLHIFNMSNQHSGRQTFALFSAIIAYAKHIDQLENLAELVVRIANKHASLNIQAEQYDIVGHHLIETLRELAGSVFTSEIEAAWTAAYQVLAGIFIEKESSIYYSNEQEKGGWKGKRAFKLIEKRFESKLVKSFIFEPCDQEAVLDYQPGQYIGIEVSPSRSDYREIRQYSLSDKANGNSYQISVKRELEGQPGVVSNFLHDELGLGAVVSLFAPSGDFFLQKNDKPKVLISAGVGITPMQAMLETLVEQADHNDIYFLHACENSEQHSFKQRLNQLSQQSKVDSFTWYNNEKVSAKNVFHGYMDIDSIANQLPVTQGEFYLCGPTAFMQFARRQLLALGVDSTAIHYEVFGPHEDL